VPERFVIRPDDLGYEPVDDEMLVIDFVSSDYFLLNATGAAVWRALAAAPRTVDEVAAAFAAGDDATRDAMCRDLDPFVGGLAAAGLLVRADGTADDGNGDDGGASAPVPDLVSPYVVPRFERFGTLERLMLAGE
jgi:hypothetical protein